MDGAICIHVNAELSVVVECSNRYMMWDFNIFFLKKNLNYTIRVGLFSYHHTIIFNILRLYFLFFIYKFTTLTLNYGFGVFLSFYIFFKK